MEVTVTTPYKPDRVRKFKAAGGVRKFTAVKAKSTTREVMIVAKAAKKAPKNKKAAEAEVTDDELEELTEDDLDDLEDELEDLEDDDEVETEDEDVEDDESDDEDEEDEDEEPAPKKKGMKARQSRAKSNGKVGTAEIAEEAGVDARTLRMVLRKHQVPKDEETGRYEWDSLENKTVKKILKWIKAGEADAIKKEGLDRLKAQQEKKRAAKKEGGKKNKKGGKKAKKVVEDEEDDE